MDWRSVTAPGRQHIPPALTALTLGGALAILVAPIVAPLALFVALAAGVGGPAVGIFAAHLLLVAATGTLTGLEIIVFETALAPLLAMPVTGAVDRTSTLASWLGAVGLGAIVILAMQATDADWLLAVTVISSTALALYLIHRIELVSLDLVPDDTGGSSSHE